MILTLAHQYITQLDEKIRESAFGNIGTLVSFRVSSQDAEVLAKYMTPVFVASDLMNISNYKAYLKLMIDGQPSRPFNIDTINPEKPAKSHALDIKKISRDNYCRDRMDVEKEIQSRYQIAREEEEEDDLDEDLKFDFLGKDKDEKDDKEN